MIAIQSSALSAQTDLGGDATTWRVEVKRRRLRRLVGQPGRLEEISQGQRPWCPRRLTSRPGGALETILGTCASAVCQFKICALCPCISVANSGRIPFFPTSHFYASHNTHAQRLNLFHCNHLRLILKKESQAKTLKMLKTSQSKLSHSQPLA